MRYPKPNGKRGIGCFLKRQHIQSAYLFLYCCVTVLYGVTAYRTVGICGATALIMLCSSQVLGPITLYSEQILETQVDLHARVLTYAVRRRGSSTVEWLARKNSPQRIRHRAPATAMSKPYSLLAMKSCSRVKQLTRTLPIFSADQSSGPLHLGEHKTRSP